MWTARALEILSLVFGVSAAVVLYKSTLGWGPTPYWSKEVEQQVKAVNKKLKLMQRLGFGLLLASLLCGLAHVFVE
jgi:hypothetical protein